MPKFNHMYTIAFTVDSFRKDAEDVTAAMLTAAILKRVSEIIVPQPNNPTPEIIEACGGPDDTYQYDEV